MFYSDSGVVIARADSVAAANASKIRERILVLGQEGKLKGLPLQILGQQTLAYFPCVTQEMTAEKVKSLLNCNDTKALDAEGEDYKKNYLQINWQQNSDPNNSKIDKLILITTGILERDIAAKQQQQTSSSLASTK